MTGSSLANFVVSLAALNLEALVLYCHHASRQQVLATGTGDPLGHRRPALSTIT